MVDVEDVNRFERLFDGQLERLRGADIHEDDRQAIVNFVQAQEAGGGVATSTLTGRMNRLRLAAERASKPLVEMDHDDVNALLFELRHEHDLSEGTLRNYRKALRQLFKHRNEEWWEDIEIGASPSASRTVEPSELLDDEEIDAMFDAARNPRDKAIMALMLDTALRIGAIASLRIKDLSLTPKAGELTINQEGPTKGANGTVPITWSRSHLVNWLEVHPRRDDPDAALIHVLPPIDDDVGDGALQTPVLRKRLYRLADDAGLERERVKPHRWRKTAIAEWALEGFSDQQIKHRATWAQDSDQFKRYAPFRDQEMNDEILAQYGLANGGVSGPSLDSCPQCGASVRDDSTFCSQCGTSLSQAAAEVTNTAADVLTDDMVDSDRPTDREIAAAVQRKLREDPSFLEGVVGEIIDDHSEGTSSP